MRSIALLLAEMIQRLSFPLSSPRTQNETKAHLGTCQTLAVREDLKQDETSCQDNSSPCKGFFTKEILSLPPPPPPLFVSKYSLNSPKHFWHEEKVKRPKSTNSDYFSIRTLHQKYRLIHKDPRDLKWQTGIWVSLQKPGCLQTQTDFVCKCRHVRACGNFEDWHKIIHL